MEQYLKELLDFYETEDGKRYIEKQNKKMLFTHNLVQSWIDKLHDLSVCERDVFINKVIKKYTSDEYIERWYKRSIEPECYLYSLIYEYGKKYGSRLPDEKDNPFPHTSYLIDDKYIVRIMIGQGTVFDVWEKD